MRQMHFKEELEKKVQEAERCLEQFLPPEQGYQRTVIEAMNYSVRVGGKRLRPLFMLESYRLFGGNSPVVEPFMAAIEMIHTYSLVHDDLPCMDNDEYRRGKKTTHVAYGEGMAVLAGDGLLNLAFETATKAFDMEPGNQNLGKALRILAEKAGIYGMIGGQCADIEGDIRGDKEKLDFIFRLKTCALIEAAMVVGAALAGATTQEQAIMERVARNVGMAFQIQDDILDVAGDEAVIGKPLHSDEKNSKETYVSIYGLERAREDVKAYSQAAISQLHSLAVKNVFLDQLIQYLVDREK